MVKEGKGSTLDPFGTRCVFVNAGSVPRVREVLWSGGDSGLSTEDCDLWAVLLLHEAGHIHHRDYEQGIDGDEDGAERFNLTTTIAKKREELADGFAAKCIREAARPDSETLRFRAGNRLQLTIASIGWNEARDRLIDHFGATATGNRSVFWDEGYSHPNLRLRFLRIGHLVHPTESSRALLEAFEAAQSRGRSEVLFGQDASEK